MKMTKMIFAGFGGQGVLSMGIILAYGAMDEGLQATFLPSYGPEMRGGTANCNVCISDQPVPSPIVSRADVLVAMNRPSLEKFEAKVKTGGTIIVNSDVCDIKVTRTDVNVVYAPVLSRAIELGNAKMQNTVMLGVIQNTCHLLSDENAISGMNHLLGSKPKLLDANHAAYFSGKSL